MKREKAFTLIELLVVVSIIALLVSILLPALNKARDAAKAVVCQTNLHSSGTILFLYAEDHNNRLQPDWWSFPYIAARKFDATMGDVMWHYCAQDYWDDPEILFCPTASKVASIEGQTPDPDAQFPEWGHTNWAWYTPWAPPLKATGKPAMSSYGINDYASTPLRDDPQQLSEDKQQYWGTMNQRNSSNIPMIFDSAWYAITPLDTSLPNPNPLDKYHWPYTFGPATLPRHNDMINMTFLDGSLQRVGILKLWSLKWSKTFNTNNDVNKPDYVGPEWVEELRN